VSQTDSSMTMIAAKVWHREDHHTEIHFGCTCAVTGSIMERENKAMEQRRRPNKKHIFFKFCTQILHDELVLRLPPTPVWR
jgi:hypothetical protein